MCQASDLLRRVVLLLLASIGLGLGPAPVLGPDLSLDLLGLLGFAHGPVVLRPLRAVVRGPGGRSGGGGSLLRRGRLKKIRMESQTKSA